MYVLKPEHIEVVEWLSAGHDVLSNLPTGFGKSSIYEVRALNSDRVHQKMGNSVAFSREIMRQERSIMRQIMRLF